MSFYDYDHQPKEFAHHSSHRWRSVQLGYLRQETVTSTLALAMPRLEDLHLTDCDVPGDVDPSAGRLLHVRFQSMSLRWLVLMMQNLETIELRGIRCVGSSTAQLLDMLRSSPALIRLTMEKFSHRDEDDVPNTPILNNIAPVPLNHLRVLDVSCLPVTIMHDLLTHIHVPRCRYLRLVGFSDPDSLIIVHLLPTIRSILETADTLHLELWCHSKILASTEGSSGVGLDLYQLDNALPALLAWLVPVLQSNERPPSVKLQLEAPTAPATFEEVWPLFDLPCPITSLKLRGPEVEPYVELLSSPSVVLVHGSNTAMAVTSVADPHSG